MKLKSFLVFIFSILLWQGAVANSDVVIFKSDKGEISLGKKTPNGEWRTASYKNKEVAFNFPIDDPEQSFYGDEYNFSKNRKYFMLATAHDNSNGQRCYIVHMDSGCVVYMDFSNSFCSLSWSNKKDAVLELGDESHDVSEYDVRIGQQVTTIEEFNYLQELNQGRAEKICGVVPDHKNNKANIVKPEVLAGSGVELSIQDILKACKTKCNLKDLAGIDVKTISTIPKSQISSINDVAFYMWKNGLNASAIDLLAKVIKADPDRVPAYLNLADALWDERRQVEAINNYEIYCQKMKQLGKENKVPSRVADRLKNK